MTQGHRKLYHSIRHA